MPVDVGQPLEHRPHPGANALLWEQPVPVLHKLVQVAVLQHTQQTCTHTRHDVYTHSVQVGLQALLWEQPVPVLVQVAVLQHTHKRNMHTQEGMLVNGLSVVKPKQLARLALLRKQTAPVLHQLIHVHAVLQHTKVSQIVGPCRAHDAQGTATAWCCSAVKQHTQTYT
jgi:hypothetical protein